MARLPRTTVGKPPGTHQRAPVSGTARPGSIASTQIPGADGLCPDGAGSSFLPSLHDAADAAEASARADADQLLQDQLDGLGNPPNPLQVALLRWYAVNQTGLSFPVGSFAGGVAFDGANIWVTSSGSNNVTKLRASDGANLGTFDVGGATVGIAFDGTNISG